MADDGTRRRFSAARGDTDGGSSNPEALAKAAAQRVVQEQDGGKIEILRRCAVAFEAIQQSVERIVEMLEESKAETDSPKTKRGKNQDKAGE